MPLRADSTVTGWHGQTKGTECMHTRYESICSTIHSTDSEYYTLCITTNAIRDAMMLQVSPKSQILSQTMFFMHINFAFYFFVQQIK